MINIRLNDSIATFLKTHLGWEQLTEIQKQAIPEVMQGNNVLIVSGTASGKTEAAMLPILEDLLKNRYTGLNCLYFAPLKALINDLSLRLKQVFEPFGFRVERWHGDVSYSDKAEAMKNARILVTTPESMESLLTSKHINKDLFGNLRYLIVDEIHSFVSGPRGAQIASQLERLELRSSCRVQRLAMSATVGNPEDLVKWLSGGSTVTTSKIQDKFLPNRELKALMDYQVNPVELIAKLQESGNRKIIVFAGSRKNVELFVSLLNNHDIEAYPHHSSISRGIRESAEKSFKSADNNQIVVTTTTLELGIDIGDVDNALFLDVPYSMTSFLQSIGRTGRRTLNSRAWLLVKSKESILRLIGLMKMLENKTVEKLRPLSYYPQLLGHQLISISYEKGKIDPKDLIRLRQALPFKRMRQEDFESLVTFLINGNFLARDNKDLLVPSSSTYEIMEIGNNKKNFVVLFPGSADFTVLFNGLDVGTLQPLFVLSLLETLERKGVASFVLAKEIWTVVRIDTRRRKIYVERGKEEVIPSWTSMGPRIDLEFAQAVKSVLLTQEIPSSIELSRLLREEMTAVIDSEKHTVGTTDLLISSLKTGVFFDNIIYSYFGDIGNVLFEELLRIVGEKDIERNWRSVQFRSRRSPDMITEEIRKLANKGCEFLVEIITQSIAGDPRRARMLYLQLGDTLSNYAPEELKIRSIAEYIVVDEIVHMLRN